MAVSLIMSRRCAFTLAKASPAVALLAPRSSIGAMNRSVDGSHGHGSKLCDNINSSLQQCKSSRFFSSASDHQRRGLDEKERDGLLSSGINRIIDGKMAGKSMAPFTVHIDYPGYLSLRRRYKKESINVHVWMHALDSVGNEDGPVPLVIVISKGWFTIHSLNLNVKAHKNKLELIHGIMTFEDEKTELLRFREEDSEINKHFMEYLDIRGINTSMINRLRQHKDSILHGKTDWLYSFKKFMES